MNENLKNQLLEHLKAMIASDIAYRALAGEKVVEAELASKDAVIHERKLRSLTVMLGDYGIDYDAIWNEGYRKNE